MTNQPHEELRPCPFCGDGPSYYTGPRFVETDSALYRGRRDVWVQCAQCGAHGPCDRANHAEPQSEDLARSRWNTRAPQPQAGEVVAWRCKLQDDDEWELCFTDPRCDTTDFEVVQPLYAHPQGKTESTDQGGCGMNRPAMTKDLHTEQGSSSLREAVEWVRMADRAPEPGHKFVALFDDGSGAWLGFAHDAGVIDSDGDDHTKMPNAEWWAYLPSGFRLACEDHPAEDYNLPEHVCPPILSALSSRPEGGFSASSPKSEDTRRAPEAGVVGWQPTHRHIKSGGYYQVVGRGRDITNEHGEPGIEVVVYRGVGGHLWVRRAAEFDDGRFVTVEPNPPAEKGEGGAVRDHRHIRPPRCRR